MEKALTFAEKARVIKKKYEKYGEDPIALRSMEIELSELAKEQELMKQQMQQTEEQVAEDVTQQYAYGGKVKKYSKGGGFGIPFIDAIGPSLEEQAMQSTQGLLSNISDIIPKDLNSSTSSLNSTPEYFPLRTTQDRIARMKANSAVGQEGSLFYGGEDMRQEMKRMGEEFDPSLPGYTLPTVEIRPDSNTDQSFSFNNEQKSKDPILDDDYSWTKEAMGFMDGERLGTEKALDKLSPLQFKEQAPKIGWSGLLGSVGSGIAALRNPRSTPLQTVSPNLIDSTAQEKIARDNINTSYNNISRASRETAQTAGQRMGRNAGTQADRMRNLNNTLLSIRERTDNANAAIENQFAQYNNQITNQNILNRDMDNADAINRQNMFFDSLAKSIAMRERDNVALGVQERQNVRLLNLISQRDFITGRDGKITPRV